MVSIAGVIIAYLVFFIQMRIKALKKGSGRTFAPVGRDLDNFDCRQAKTWIIIGVILSGTRRLKSF